MAQVCLKSTCCNWLFNPLWSQVHDHIRSHKWCCSFCEGTVCDIRSKTNISTGWSILHLFSLFNEKCNQCILKTVFKLQHRYAKLWPLLLSCWQTGITSDLHMAIKTYGTVPVWGREKRSLQQESSSFCSCCGCCCSLLQTATTTSRWLFTAWPATVARYSVDFALFPPCICSEPQLHPAATRQKRFRQRGSGASPTPPSPSPPPRGDARETVEWALCVIRVPASTVHYHRPKEEIRSGLRIHPHGMSLSVTPGAASVLSALTTHTCANTLAGSRRVNKHCPERLRGESLLVTTAG